MGNLFEWIRDLFRDIRFWFTVDPWEKAVRVRAGKHSTILGPGLHWKIPGIDEIYIVNTRLRIGPTSSQVISSKDNKIVTIGIQLGFSINDPLLALTTYLHPENSLAVLAQNHVAEYVLSTSSDNLSTLDLEDAVLSGLKDSDPNSGMLIEFIKVTSLVISGPARTLRLVSDSIHNDWSTDVGDRVKWQPHVTQW